MSPTATLILYCGLILLASLAGGWIPLVVKLTHKRMELAVSFVAGVMLGVGLLHMLPHAVMERMEALGDADALEAHHLLNPLMLWLLAGFLLMFFIERFFCFHHHDVPATVVAAPNHDQQDHRHEPAAACATSHDGHDHHRLTWAGAGVGLTLHSLIDGVALAASIQAAREDSGDRVALAAFGTFLVIFLHKPFDSLTLGTLMAAGGHSAASRHLVNAAFSLLVVVGAVLFLTGVAEGEGHHFIVSAALAFSAGTFLCIAMSDLLPELQFHQHDRLKLTTSLIAGLAVAWAIGAFEARSHEHEHSAAESPAELHHHDHD